MTLGGRRLRQLITEDTCHVAAPVYDPLSARLADMRGWRVGKLSGSAWKAANMAMPDDVALTTMQDLVAVSRNVMEVSDLCLIVDADDGGGTAVNVLRTVRQLEAAGVAAIEIEDNAVPRYYGESSRHGLAVSQAEQVGKLKAALDARRHDSTMIVARLIPRDLPAEEVLERAAAYAAAGVDALMVAGLNPPRDGRKDVADIHGVTGLPLFALGFPWSIGHDRAFLAENNVRLRYVSYFPLLRLAIKAIETGLETMENDGDPDGLGDRMAPIPRLRNSGDAVSREGEFRAWSDAYVTR